MAALISRQILRRLQVSVVPKFSQVLSFHGENAAPRRTPQEVEEYRKRQLWLKFSDGVKFEDVYGLSEDIQRVNIRPQQNGCFVYVDFASEEIAEANFAELEKAGIWVNYCGVKRRLNDHKKYIAKEKYDDEAPYYDENAEKKLRLLFNAAVTEDDIWALSPDIVKVKVTNKGENTKVIVEFEAEEQVELHYDFLQLISVRECRAKVYRCTSGKFKQPPTDLLVKEVGEDETEESLLAEFPGSKSVHLFYSLYNQRYARVRYRDNEECMKAFDEHGARRNVKVYHKVENRDIDRRTLNKLELRMKLKPWHTKDSLKQMFRRAVSFRFYNRLHIETGNLSKFVFITFDNEEDASQAFYAHKQFDVQYCFVPEFDHKTLVLNDIADWDDEESLRQLYPDVSKIYIHKTVSKSGERTLRNAFLLFDCEDKCKAVLDANVRRRLHYRIIR